MIKEKEIKHNIIVLLSKNKVSSIKDLIFSDLINSNISHHEFVSVNDVLRESGDIKETIKNLKTSTAHLRF